MASRWMKRSQEEKDKIKKDTDERWARHEAKKEGGKVFTRVITAQVQAQKILKQGLIPLVCMRCIRKCNGVVSAAKYELITKKHPLFGRELTYAKGICPYCGNEAGRFVDVTIMTPDELMVYPLIINDLINKGICMDMR